MNRSNQYRDDCTRLSELIEQYTGIPKEQVFSFVMENSASALLYSANSICKTAAQRNKLSKLFEFKKLFTTLNETDNNRSYRLGDTESAKVYFRNYYSNLGENEMFSVAFLDSQNRLIATKIITTGTVNEAAVYPREIIKEALFYNASSVILAHNHPGGSLKPSNCDIQLTERLKLSFDMIQVHLIDHIIIGDNRAVSLAEYGHIHASSGNLSNTKAASSQEEKQRYDTEEKQKYNPGKKQPSVKQQLTMIKENRNAIPSASNPSRGVTNEIDNNIRSVTDR